MKTKFKLLFLTIFLLSMLNNINAQTVALCYQPEFVPLKLCFDSEGDLYVSAEYSVPTPIGTFSLEGAYTLSSSSNKIIVIQDTRTAKDYSYEIKKGKDILTISGESGTKINSVKISTKVIIINITTSANSKSTITFSSEKPKEKGSDGKTWYYITEGTKVTFIPYYLHYNLGFANF